MHHRIYQNFIIKSETGNGVIISGYASVYNIVDQHNDVIIKGAFALKQDCSNIKFLWQHNSLKPIGIIQSLLEDDYGLKIEAIINSKIEAGKEAISLVQQGAVSGLSIGFSIKSSHYNNTGQRIITKAELGEVSIVTFPANRQAQISYVANQNIKAQLESLKSALLNLDTTVNSTNHK